MTPRPPGVPLSDADRCADERGRVSQRFNPPPWLTELAHELCTQNNRITQNPLFCVQQERFIWGMEKEYSDGFMWRRRGDSHSCDDDEIYNALREDDDDNELVNLEDHEIDPEDYGYEKVFYLKYWDFVTAHFTEKAAERYLRQNAHNLNSPRVFVTSQYRCNEWNRVRAFLMAGCKDL